MKKLSDLMFQGIGDTRQCFTKYFEYEKPDGIHPIFSNVVGCCALGAAMKSYGTRSITELFRAIDYNPVDVIIWDSPTGSDEPIALWDIIVELNDIAKWSREDIAAWIRSIGL